MSYSSESSELPDVAVALNILSFQRLDSNEIFLKSPSIGTIANISNAHTKFTPRFTFCSTLTVTGIWTCQFCHVPSTLSLYLPAGNEDNIASFDFPPSVHAPSLSLPL